jgi:hypothetical protein
MYSIILPSSDEEKTHLFVISSNFQNSKSRTPLHAGT